MTPSPRLSALLAAVLTGIAVAVLVPAPARAADATAAFVSRSRWATGYVGQMTVRNDTAAPLTAWRVEFDLPAGTTVGNHWNATLTRTGNRHVFTGLSWNARVEPGATTTFGWVADGTGEPDGCSLNGAPCAGGPPPGRDVRPPSVPTNLRYSPGGGNGGLTLVSWEPSTDDRGVAGYEVFMNGHRIATTVGTSHLMPTPPPMLFVLAVRAFDAAGNLSPFLVSPVGIPDATPPSPPTGLRLGGPVDGHLLAEWTASRDNTIVAGYHVYLNGTLVSSVGGTSAWVPYRAMSTYVVTVFAFDGSGNRSVPASAGLVFDFPPPPSPSPSPAR